MINWLFMVSIIRGYELTSTEGTTQGHRITMIIYTIATIRVILITIERMHDQLGNT